jgi:uncharacterized protein (DUF2141 family)
MIHCKSKKAPKETPAVTTKDATADKDTTAAVEPEKTAMAPEALAKQEPLTLIITNLASATATVTVGVYGTKNKFPDPNDQLKEYKFKPHGLKLIAKIPDLKFGTYALATYQDVKNTGKISKNLIGIPTDPYAFSNNYKPVVKAPGFTDCKFEYDAKNHSVTMNMIK